MVNINSDKDSKEFEASDFFPWLSDDEAAPAAPKKLTPEQLLQKFKIHFGLKIDV